MFTYRQHSAGQNHSIKVHNITFENSASFKCLGMTSIETVFTKLLWTDEILETPANIQLRIFFLPVRYLEA